MKEAKINRYEIDMCSGSILKKMLQFTIPLMCSSVMQLMYNACDVIIVGKFAGDNALAAVGSTTSLINLLTNIFMGLSIGANVLVARFFGSKQQKSLDDTVHTAMLLSVIGGIIVSVIGVIGAEQILTWMQTPEDVLGLAVLYLRIYFMGMTATMIYNFGAAILRAVGDTKRPLYFLLFSGIVNVVLNLIFVIIFKMSVAGVALATVTSQIISAILVVRCMIKGTGSIKLVISELKIHKDKFIKMLQIGVPASIQGIIFSLSNVIIQSSVNSFGATVVAGNSAASNLEGFVFAAMNAFHQGAISFTSQNMGAGKYERINKILLTAQGCVIVVGIVFGNLLASFGEPLLGLYTSNPEVVDAGMIRLNLIARVYALCGMMDVMVGGLRGLGYSVIPMIVSMLGACGIRLLWIFTIFQLENFHRIELLYIVYAISWTITLMAHIVVWIIAWKRIKRRINSKQIQTI